MKSDEEIGREAGAAARAKTLRLLKQGKGPSLTKTLQQLKRLLEAKTVRVFNDKEGIVYSKEIEDNPTQVKAVQIALDLHDAMPNKKHEVTGPDGGALIIEVVKFGQDTPTT